MSTRQLIPSKSAAVTFPSFTPVRSGLLQHKCACGGTHGPTGKCEECRKKKLQRKTLGSDASSQPSTFDSQTFEVPPIVDEVLRSPGQPLDNATRAFMEPRFGQDFSRVRVHADRHAAASAQAIDSLAYTVGQDIVFGIGQYMPTMGEGRRLVAHELAHVVQQKQTGATTGPKAKLEIASPRDMAEQEAEELATRVANGQPTQADQSAWGSLQSALPGVIQRQRLPPPAVSPADQVMQALAVMGPGGGVRDFPAAFRILNRLGMDELLNTLTDLEGRRQLDVLIANAVAVPPFNPARVDTAMRVVRQSHGAGANLRTAQATIAASGLPPGDQAAMTNYLLPLRPAVPGARGADQRAAIAPGGPASLPNVDLTRELGYELDPVSRPAAAPPPPRRRPGVPAPPPPPPPARVPWDGRTGAPGQVAARTAMQAELFAAFDAYLTFNRAATLAALARPRVAFTAPAAPRVGAAPPPTGVVDIANQARTALETRYGTSMDVAASSPTQVANRSVRQSSGPGQNIFDVSSEADRSTLTTAPDLARGVAWWLFENDRPGAAGAAGSRRFATDVLAAHHYSPQDPGAEQFRWDVDAAYTAAATLAPNNRRQLIDYRMTGWSESGGRGFTLQSSFDPGGNRNRAELAQRWQIFKTATHESLHLRAHPAFVAAEQGRGTMKEGFVEMFTIATLNTDVLPRARAGSVEPLRQTVEGALSPPAPDATLITNSVTPAQYAAHRAQAERIRDGGTPPGASPHAGVGEAAVRAAFFQGHVEYLGLAPTGAQLAGLPARGVAARTRIPGGVASLDDLARRSGVPRATIVRDNPGITDALPATAVLTGCREHWVVAGETRAKIAGQHGVSEADLVRANPDVPTDMANVWPALTVGQKILIPVH